MAPGCLLQGYTNVAKKLLEKGALVLSQNIEGQMPLEVAVLGGFNDFAVLMAKSMDPVKYVSVLSASCVFIRCLTIQRL